jgi:cobalt transporter subunit CbtB
MNTPISSQTTSSHTIHKPSQILAAALLGLIVLVVVGFSPLEVIHNATHDTRHSAGFPCH